MSGVKRAEHHSEKLACGRTWMAPAPGFADLSPLRHVCRGHVIESNECLCPCGARHMNAGFATAESELQFVARRQT
jgi:hypothetical protein